MARPVNTLVQFVCPVCRKTSRKAVRRQLTAAGLSPQTGRPDWCIDCELAVAQPHVKDFLVRQARAMWLVAGGALDELPDVLRRPSDPPKRNAAPVALQRPTAKPVPGFAGRGKDTPTWKSNAKVLPVTKALPGRPRVLFVAHDLYPQGAEKFLLNLLPRLRGMEVLLLALQGGLLQESFRQQGIRVLHGDWPNAVDLVVANTLASHEAVVQATQRNIPCVWINHECSVAPFLTSERYQELAAGVWKNVFVHRTQRERFPEVQDHRDAIIPPIIPPILPKDRAVCRKELKVEPQTCLVVSFGRDEPRKGLSDLREAASGLDLQVKYVSGETNPMDWLAAADMYVSCSRDENYPLSLQEAKAFGLPVIATSLPCHRDMIVEGVNGYLYEPGDTEALRELLQRLQSDTELRRNLGKEPIRGQTWEESLMQWERLFLAAAGGGVLNEEELRVVYHACGMGDHWQAVFDEQLSQLAQHGLRKVYVSHCGEGLDWLLQRGKTLGMELVVSSHHDNLDVFERPGIQLVEWLAKTSDKPIMYLHSKGVSHSVEQVWYTDWRHLIMDELIPNWRRHCLALDEYDAVGVNWWKTHNKQHFSGNLWMAHPRWLRKLPPIKDYWRDRFSAERWIGAVNGCNAKTLLCSDAAFWDRDRQLLTELRNAQILRQKRAEARQLEGV